MVTSYTVVHTVVLKAHQCLLQLVIYVFLTLNLSAWEHYLAGSDFIFTLAASSAGEESCIPKLLIHTVTEPVENNTQPIFSFLFFYCCVCLLVLHYWLALNDYLWFRLLSHLLCLPALTRCNGLCDGGYSFISCTILSLCFTLGGNSRILWAPSLWFLFYERCACVMGIVVNVHVTVIYRLDNMAAVYKKFKKMVIPRRRRKPLHLPM